MGGFHIYSCFLAQLNLCLTVLLLVGHPPPLYTALDATYNDYKDAENN